MTPVEINRAVFAIGSAKDHPKIMNEVERHKRWGHNVINITEHGHRWNGYLCSCGAHLGMNLI